MSTLCDRQIKELCENGLVSPYDEAMINPASLDIRVGNMVLLPDVEPNSWTEFSIREFTEEYPFLITPHQFLLIESLETFHFPTSVCGQFILKSSRGREGFQHCLAGFCDPGWNNSKLTMEVYNVSPWSIKIYPGLRIGQIEIKWMDERPQKSYAVTGRYNNDQKVMFSKG